MNLYYLTQDSNNDYDTYDSVIVAAKSEDEARVIHPAGEPLPHWNPWEQSSWVPSPDLVKVYLIGTAIEGTEQGVVLASFNAG